jgi:3-oxoacid CoA-transferase subunit B
MRCVDLVITDLGVVKVDREGDAGFELVELAPGVSEAEFMDATQASVRVRA